MFLETIAMLIIFVLPYFHLRLKFFDAVTFFDQSDLSSLVMKSSADILSFSFALSLIEQNQNDSNFFCLLNSLTTVGLRT